jgi:hypothetical protein
VCQRDCGCGGGGAQSWEAHLTDSGWWYSGSTKLVLVLTGDLAQAGDCYNAICGTRLTGVKLGSGAVTASCLAQYHKTGHLLSSTVLD